ncbi:MAG: hypothetical protein ACI311_01970 [Bacilli bacterium]
MNLTFLIWGSAVLLSFILLVFFGCFLFKLATKKNYSLLSYFPFEIFHYKNGNLNIILQVLCIIFCATYGIFNINVFTSYFGSLFKIEIVFIAFITILTICIFYLQIGSDKVHIIGSVFFLVFSTMNSFYLSYILYVTNYILVYKAVNYIIFGLAIIKLVLILNPKMKTCFKLYKDEDGDLYRPKVFYLAFCEWAILILNIVEVILIATGLK